MALVLVVLSVAYVVNIYNQLVNLDNRSDQAKRNVDVLLTQRQDAGRRNGTFLELDDELDASVVGGATRSDGRRRGLVVDADRIDRDTVPEGCPLAARTDETGAIPSMRSGSGVERLGLSPSNHAT